MLAKLQLSKKEQELIFQHFGHSERINKEVYQAPPGSMQLQTTGKRLLQINTGLRKDERSIVSDTWNNKCSQGKKNFFMPPFFKQIIMGTDVLVISHMCIE